MCRFGWSPLPRAERNHTYPPGRRRRYRPAVRGLHDVRWPDSGALISPQPCRAREHLDMHWQDVEIRGGARGERAARGSVPRPGERALGGFLAGFLLGSARALAPSELVAVVVGENERGPLRAGSACVVLVGSVEEPVSGGLPGMRAWACCRMRDEPAPRHACIEPQHCVPLIMGTAGLSRGLPYKQPCRGSWASSPRSFVRPRCRCSCVQPRERCMYRLPQHHPPSIFVGLL